MVELPAVGSRISATISSLNGDVEVSGVILPPAQKGHVTLKLVNGYNSSYPAEQIIAVELLESPSDSDEVSQSTSIEVDESLPTVRILHTGGTIASKVDYATGAVVARFEPEELVASVPELTAIANIQAVKLGNMFSDDIRPQHWNLITKAAKQAFDDGVDGVVVTHGTDTLHITSAALSYSWAGSGGVSPGRIVMVGSQRSSDRGSSDAAENLISAVHWAANGPAPCGDAGDSVVVVMHTSSDDGITSVHPGIGVRKMHSTRRDAFKGINTQPLASIDFNAGKPTHTLSEEYKEMLKTSSPREITTNPDTFELGIRIPQLIAGPWLFAEQIDALVNSGCQALVIQGTGLGHLPIDDPQKDAPENTAIWRMLTRCRNRDIPVVITNQCIHGPVDMNVYSKGRKQQDMGLLGHGLVASHESVMAKLHWALSKGLKIDEILSKNLCGEGNISLME